MCLSIGVGIYDDWAGGIAIEDFSPFGTIYDVKLHGEVLFDAIPIIIITRGGELGGFDTTGAFNLDAGMIWGQYNVCHRVDGNQKYGVIILNLLTCRTSGHFDIGGSGSESSHVSYLGNTTLGEGLRRDVPNGIPLFISIGIIFQLVNTLSKITVPIFIFEVFASHEFHHGAVGYQSAG